MYLKCGKNKHPKKENYNQGVMDARTRWTDGASTEESQTVDFGGNEHYVEREKFLTGDQDVMVNNVVYRTDKTIGSGLDRFLKWGVVVLGFFIAFTIMTALVIMNSKKSSMEESAAETVKIYAPVEVLAEQDPDGPDFQIINRSGYVISLNGEMYSDAENVKRVPSKEMYVDGQKVYGIAKKDLILPEGKYELLENGVSNPVRDIFTIETK